MSAHGTSPRRTKFAALLGVFAVVVGILTAVAPPVGQQSASAADARDFQDGYLISDSNFFASTSMTAGDVQAFLNARVPNCRGTNGWPCLRNYSQSTPSVAADAYCQRFPGGQMSGAQIIAAVAQACGISPKVLIVMLQKEQGLITDTAPVEWSYKAALGQACPDNAPCDPNFAGFFYQVYGGARQMQKYIQRPEWWAYQLGWNNILYSPYADRGCGTKRVNILNNATRALYIYTPYTPNTAALNNLYGEGDRCSTYGNRNFWRLYTDWFGNPTGHPGELAIAERYRLVGGASGWLGTSTSPIACGIKDNGCWQTFQNGAILYSPTTGANEMNYVMHASWGGQGFENGWMGYPTSPTVCGIKDNGCWQTFQGGPMLYSPATGAQPMTATMHTAWGAQGYENGWMGYPTSPTVCGIKDNGCWQTFQNGPMLYSPATGAQPMTTTMHTGWGTQGYENGWMGYPTSPTVCGIKDNGCWQTFQGGPMLYSPATGAQPMTTTMHTAWGRQGYENGWMGYPTSPTVCGIKDNGCWQTFQTGAMLYSPATGAQPMRPAIHAAWATQGYENGWLGYPTGPAQTNSAGDTTQAFQAGAIIVNAAGSPTYAGNAATTGAAAIANTSRGATWLGSATTPVVCGAANDGCWRAFQNGVIMYSPPTGAQSVRATVHQAWVTQKHELGWLGYPTSGSQPAGSGFTQTFQGGSITVDAAGKPVFSGSGTNTPQAAIANELVVSAWLGATNTPVVCGSANGGCWQAFQNGVIMYSPATGAKSVRAVIHQSWVRQGYENGWMGYPTSQTVCGIKDNGCWQTFQGGPMLYSPATGAQPMTTTMHTAWGTQGYENGWMGYPTSPTVCGIKNNGCWQTFQSGAILYSPATGAKPMRPAIHAAWGTQGYENGWLGYPTTDSVAATGGGYTQSFQSGTIAIDGNGTVTITAN